MNNNVERVTRAQVALDAYTSLPGVDQDEAFRDLLADLMHLADRVGINFKHELAMAEMNYDAEVE